MWSFTPASEISGYEITASMLNAKSAAAVRRVPSPRASSTGSASSAPVPRAAATIGEITGTWYSFSKSASVVPQSRVLVRPERKNTWAT